AQLLHHLLVHRAATKPRTRQTVLRSCLACAVVGAVVALASMAVIPEPIVHGPTTWLAIVTLSSLLAGLVGVLLAGRRTGLGRGPAARSFVYGALLAFTMLVLRFVYETRGR